MEYLKVSSLLLWLNLWLSVTIGHVQSHASMYRLNYFPSGDLSELSLITYYLLLIPFNYLDSGVLTLNSTWKMVKDTPNHITENTIG